MTELGPQISAVLRRVHLTDTTAHVSWASDRPVPRWLEVGRELSEYWIHRQQLLQAVDRAADLRPDLLGPVLDALRWAYPHRLSAIATQPGDVVTIDIDGALERRWTLVNGGHHWQFAARTSTPAVAAMRLDADDAWRLLTNNRSTSTGDLDLHGDDAYVQVLYATRAIIGHPNNARGASPSP